MLDLRVWLLQHASTRTKHQGASPVVRAGGSFPNQTRPRSWTRSGWRGGLEFPVRGGDCECPPPRRRREELPTIPEADRVRSKYAFIEAHRKTFATDVMCRHLGVAPSGYYARLQHPRTNQAIAVARLLRLIHASFTPLNAVVAAVWQCSVAPPLPRLTLRAQYSRKGNRRNRHHSYLDSLSPKQFEAAHKHKRRAINYRLGAPAFVPGWVPTRHATL